MNEEDHRMALRWMVALLSLALVAVSAHPVAAQAGRARVRVVHASPDAPAVDVIVNNVPAFRNIAFKGVTAYASLAPGRAAVQVVPAGATQPVVIDAALDLRAGADYTVIATGRLAGIAPLVLMDDNTLPVGNRAHVRFVHASPNAPAVDIAVKGGPVLFQNIAFRQVGTYTPVPAGTYDLEVRVAGTNTVALEVPQVRLSAGTVYTVYAVGLVGEQPALEALLSVDATAQPQQLPRTGGAVGAVLPLLLALGAILIVAWRYGYRARLRGLA
jgi:hypothetical protein